MTTLHSIDDETEASAIIDTFAHALSNARQFKEPYRHWMLSRPLPDAIAAELCDLEFPVVDLAGRSGKRELHNDQRHYFDAENIARHRVIASVAEAFQAPRMVRTIADFFGADIEDRFLRIEYAQDVSGFWLEPHTDIGVKYLTLQFYLSNRPDQDNLGTDIYDSTKAWVKRIPFAHNSAYSFVPGDITYHGFEKREIAGVRKTLILNYVSDEWRDREQLAFPDKKVRAA